MPSVESPRKGGQSSMASLTVLSMGICVLVLVLSGGLQETRGVGHAELTIQLIVIDSASLSPICGASVYVHEVDEQGARPGYQTETSIRGDAAITRQFQVNIDGGSVFGRTRSVVAFGDVSVLVAAPGYKSTQIWLQQSIGRYDLKLSPPEPVVAVRLERLSGP